MGRGDGTVEVFREGPLAVITIDRRRRHNALVPGLLDALLGALESPEALSAKGWLVRAEGPSFSTGGDLAAFHAQGDAVGPWADRLVGRLNQTILALYAFPGAVACAVHARVTGGALGLLLASDHVAMRANVTVRPWYPAVGFAPDGGWQAMLPDRIGRDAAGEWLERDDEKLARECERLGLADTVTDDDAESEARAWLALALAGRVPAKRPGRVSVEAVSAALERERRGFVRQVTTREAREGVARYLERER